MTEISVGRGATGERERRARLAAGTPDGGDGDRVATGMIRNRLSKREARVVTARRGMDIVVTAKLLFQVVTDSACNCISHVISPLGAAMVSMSVMEGL